jgi:protoporphyrinogen oxidase
LAEVKVVIIGAGPTGLGAGYRLSELGHSDWTILERAGGVGGLAGSYTDGAGFTYDVGGHVMFSHYSYWDNLADKLMGDEYSELQREAWVWMEGRFLPYPFQSNIRHLDAETVYECVLGLIEAQRTPRTYTNFEEWVYAVHGEGIGKHFMLPYNFKVWATPPELMSYGWIGERVAVVDAAAILRNVLLGEDNRSWGPNSTFRYPRRGGTGFLWEALAGYVKDNLRLSSGVKVVDHRRRVVITNGGDEHPYDVLLSTMPLNQLIAAMDHVPPSVVAAVEGLHWSGSHIVGVGIDRPAQSTKNWIYFPEPDVPFYRVTYLSNYSPFMTADPDQMLLLTETSVSPHKPEDEETIVERVIEGLISTGLMDQTDTSRIVTTWRCSPAMTYPVPTVTRDAALGVIQPWLRSQSIFSRGRFGSWLYEIGNMDHSVMQGVETVNHVLLGEPETVWMRRGEGSAGEATP